MKIYKILITIFIPFYSLISTAIYAFDPFTIATSLAFGGAGYYFKDTINCAINECCHAEKDYLHKWIANELDYSDFSDEIFGQHIAVDVVGRLINMHLKKENPQKPLVLSFHGFTGTGKNHLCNLVAKKIYKKFKKFGKSKFVHKFIATHMKSNDLDNLVEQVKEKLDDCDRSLIIFDEIDKFPEKFLDILLPYLDFGSPYKRSIFIFLGNSAGENINNEIVHFMNTNKLREDIEYEDLEHIVTKNAMKMGGLKNSELITRGVINLFVPFLPLTKDHVRQCIIDNLKRQHNIIDPNQELIDEILNSIEFIDDEFAVYGCKRVESKVGIILTKRKRKFKSS